jgi:MoaA/NifB/PqqE/SkfB family radical SAM enzyme
MWNVFFLVPVGRGQLADLLSGEEFEQVFGKIYELSHRVNFQIKTTEAMHYRRYLLQHNLEERRWATGIIRASRRRKWAQRRLTSRARPRPTRKPAPQAGPRAA